MTITIQELAGVAFASFEQRKRDNGDEFTCLRDDAPDWLKDEIQHLHGDDILPDDWRYSKIQDLFSNIEHMSDERIRDHDLHETIDNCVDVYYNALASWVDGNTICEIDVSQHSELWVAVQHAQYDVLSAMATRCLDVLEQEFTDIKESEE